MGFFINSYRFGSVIDLSGYNITHLFAPYTTNITDISQPFSVTASGEGIIPISFDNTGVVSLSSFGMGGIIGTSKDWYYYRLFNHLDNTYYIQGASGRTSFYDSSNTLSTKNGICSVEFLGVSFIEGNALSELATGNSFSILWACSNETSATNAAVVSSWDTNDGTNNRLEMFCDRSTTKGGANIKAGGTAYILDYDAQIDSADTRVQCLTVNGSTGASVLYVDGVAQVDTETYSGTYNNTTFRVGTNFNNTLPLTGHLHTLIVADTIWDASTVGEITTKIETQLGL